MDFMETLREYQGDTETETFRKLIAARQGRGANQNKLAPAEHYAFAQSYVKDHPWAMPSMVLAAPGYYLAKKFGILSGRTEPSIEQVGAGILGAFNGFYKGTRGLLP